MCIPNLNNVPYIDQKLQVTVKFAGGLTELKKYAADD